MISLPKLFTRDRHGIRPYLSLKTNPPTTKEPMGYLLMSLVCLMVVMQYVLYMISVMWFIKTCILCIISYDQPQLRSSKMETGENGGWKQSAIVSNIGGWQIPFWCRRWIESTTIQWASFDKQAYCNNPYFRSRNSGQDGRNGWSQNPAADHNYKE